MDRVTEHDSGKVLVVDDQPNWRDALEDLLQADGHQVTTASSLAEARALLPGGAFDVALVDIRLLDEQRYDIQGVRLLREIKECCPGTRVIMMTGYAPPGTALRVRQIGAEMLAEKCPPQGFDSGQFQDLIKRLVQQAHAERHDDLSRQMRGDEK